MVALVALDRVEVEVSGVRRNGEDTKRVSVAKTALPSLDSHDGSLRLNDAQTESHPETISNPVVNVNLPLLSRNTAGFREPDGVNTSRKVELSSGLFVSGHTDDGTSRPVLGNQPGGNTGS